MIRPMRPPTWAEALAEPLSYIDFKDLQHARSSAPPRHSLTRCSRWGLPEAVVAAAARDLPPFAALADPGLELARRFTKALEQTRDLVREHPAWAGLPMPVVFGYAAVAPMVSASALAGALDEWAGHPAGWLAVAAGLAPAEHAHTQTTDPCGREALVALAGLRGHRWCGPLMALAWPRGRVRAYRPGERWR